MPLNDNDILNASLVDRERWLPILTRFVSVLRMNIFVVDAYGRPLLTSHVGGYGWRCWVHSQVGSDVLSGDSEWISKFKENGEYWESKDPFDLYTFAIPLWGQKSKVVGYILVGPVILNRRLENSEYWQRARDGGLDLDEFLDGLEEIRVVSFLDINSILGLLSQVFCSLVQVAQEASKAREEQLRALLVTAMTLAKVECGSIMMVDRESGDLRIRAAQGMTPRSPASRIRQKIGEGISGLAAQENVAFQIDGEKASDNRIKHLLNRPEIKHSLIMPLTQKDEVVGVLNLHTKNNDHSIPPDTLKALGALFSSAAI